MIHEFPILLKAKSYSSMVPSTIDDNPWWILSLNSDHEWKVMHECVRIREPFAWINMDSAANCNHSAQSTKLHQQHQS